MCKYKLSNILFLHLFKIILFIFIEKVSSKGISVSTEYQFSNNLEQQNEIFVDNIVEIKNELNVIHKEVVDISGDENSVLKLNNNFYGIYLDSIEQLYISDITIFGKITAINVEKIHFKNVYLDGKIVVYNELKDVEYIFEDCKFIPPDREDRYAFEFYKSNVTFKNCEFVGNEKIRNILYIWGNEENMENKVEIYNSYFNGEKSSLCFNGNNSNIKVYDSHFSNCNDKHEDHGAAIHIYKSIGYVENSFFENSHSNGLGGCITTITSNASFYSNKMVNCTSISGGGVFSSVENNNNEIIIKNTSIYGDPNFPYKSLGALMSFFGVLKLEIENLKAQDFHSNINGCLFFLQGYQNVFMRNITIDNISGSNIGGLFMHAIGEPSYITLDLSECHLSNFYQRNERNSCAFLWLNNVKSRISNCEIVNFGGVNNCILYQDTESYTVIENSSFDNVTSITPSIFINNNILTPPTKQTLVIRNCKFSNFITNISNLIHSNGGIVSFIDSNFENIHAINHEEDVSFCNRFPYNCALIGALEGSGIINFVNSNLTNIAGYSGFSLEQFAGVSMDNCYCQNNNLRNGHIFISNNKNCYGFYSITNSIFDNNTSKKGTVIHLDSNLYIEYGIFVNNTIIKNNHAEEYGGVIFSSSKFFNEMTILNDCQFFNNSAGQSGSILMSLNKKTTPVFKFNNEKYLNDFLYTLNDTNSFTSNPSYIACDPEKKNFSIQSGDSPFKTINCNIYDDYGNEIKFENEIDDYTLNDLLYFSVNIYDTNKKIQSNKAKIYGSHNGYCWSNTCNIGNMKVIGEEGEYKLILRLESFGKFQSFPNNEVVLDVEIMKCNETTHILQDNYDIGLKSCYLPQCFQNCNSGKCINNDLCDCSNTVFTGKYCNEYKIHKKSKILYVIYNILLFTLILVSFISMYLMNINKSYDIIKAGSIEFSYIILVGTVLYYCGTLFEINAREDIECLLSLICKQIGFTLSYGTLLIKNFRIYKIFLNDSHYEIILTRTKMYGILIVLLLIDIIVIIYWVFYENVGLKSSLNDKYQLYTSCNILRTEFIGLIKNMIILFYGAYINYLNRNIPKFFQERTSFSIYLCCIYLLIIEIFNRIYLNYNEITIFLMFFGSTVCTFLMVYSLFISKFITIYKYYVYHFLIMRET